MQTGWVPVSAPVKGWTEEGRRGDTSSAPHAPVYHDLVFPEPQLKQTLAGSLRRPCQITQITHRVLPVRYFPQKTDGPSAPQGRGGDQHAPGPLNLTWDGSWWQYWC